MADRSDDLLLYKRNHFTTRLPRSYRFSRSHYWFAESPDGSWRIGLTGFATRMLGEIVELEFELAPGAEIELGATIGWIEGFKAVSDLIACIEGSFLEANPAAIKSCDVICKKPYSDGWLYSVRGEPDRESLDVDGYVAHLDRTIDRMLEKPWQGAADAARDAASNEAAGDGSGRDEGACDSAERGESAEEMETEGGVV